MASPRSLPRTLFGRFAIALVVSLALVVSGLVTVNVIINNKIDSIDRVQLDTATDTESGEPANFLLIGSDTRQFIATGEDAFKFGDPEVESGQRSDTIMVIHVDPEQQQGFLVSFPRDLMVEIPGVGRSKLNAAFNDGPQKVIDTLKANYSVDIHHYLEIDFESFRGIVDAMGGVAVYLPAPGRDQKSQFEIPPYYGYRPFEPGCYVLDGSNALGYVRSRDYEQWNWAEMDWELTGQDAPDLHRIERQQTFMRRLAAEAVKKSISNPLKANDISDEAIAQLKADEGLGRSDINKLINAFRNVDVNDPNGSIQMTTFPTTIGPSNTGLGSVLVPREPEADQVLASLRNLTTPTEEEAGPSPSTIRVRVFNGSGVDGAADQTSGALLQQGFGTAGIGNNPAGNISTTQIRYRPGSEDKARVVQRFVGGVGELVQDSGIVEADVVLVLGRDFGGVTPPPGAATTVGGTTPTTAAPAPSGNGKTEVPPPDPTQCS